jgi:hypothetical protein
VTQTHAVHNTNSHIYTNSHTQIRIYKFAYTNSHVYTYTQKACGPECADLQKACMNCQGVACKSVLTCKCYDIKGCQKECEPQCESACQPCKLRCDKCLGPKCASCLICHCVVCPYYCASLRCCDFGDPKVKACFEPFELRCQVLVHFSMMPVAAFTRRRASDLKFLESKLICV